MLRNYLSALISFLFLVSCSAVPQPESYEYSPQKKMQAANHWDILANNVANQINIALIDQGYLEEAVYVKHACGEADPCGKSNTTPFDEGFNDLLTTQLVSFGVPTLATAEEDELTVEYKVQVIYHENGRMRVLWPGELTMLAMGIITLQNAPWEIQALAAAGVADLMNQGQVVKGNYEVIVSVSIVDNNRYIMHNSSIFYINDPNFWHYQYSSPGAEIQLTDSRKQDTFPVQNETTTKHAVQTSPYLYLPVAPLGVQ